MLAFGDLSLAEVATVGLNPSYREFVDNTGAELIGKNRRFHTLSSLGLDDWTAVDNSHLQLMLDTYCRYFNCNPYESWFRRLDAVIVGTGYSFFSSSLPACHLDLIPYATKKKWSELSFHQRVALMREARDMLPMIIRESSIRVLVLNGRSVVENFRTLTAGQLVAKRMKTWALPRRSSNGVEGIAYKGLIDEVLGISLSRSVLVLGYNHNIQSSFGVSAKVVSQIRDWITDEVRAHL